MARAGDAYGGSWGRTRTEPVHYSCPCGFISSIDVHRSINVTRDPALGTRLIEGALGAVTCPSCSASGKVEVSVVYHDEAKRRFVLVLPDALRHRELEERAELLLGLARDRGHAVPGYVRDFTVVFGGEALRQSVLPPPAAITVAEAPVPAAPVPVRLIEPLGPSIPAAPAAPAVEKVIYGDVSSGPLHTVVDDATGRFGMPEEPRPRPGLTVDADVLRWRDSGLPSTHVTAGGEIRLLFRVPRPPSGAVNVKLQLHRLPTYPIVVLAVSSSGDESDEPLTVCLDALLPADRQALGLLAQSFHLVMDFFDERYEPAARREVILPLAANVRYVLSLADEHLAVIPLARRSFEVAVTAWRAPAYDRWGRAREPVAELHEDSFALLPSASAAQKAIAVVTAVCEPSAEDELLLVRSFPLEWWRKIRARVIQRSIELGLVVPPVLVEVALADGIVRSRKELVTRTLTACAELATTRDRTFDLDPEAAAANWRTLLPMCEEERVPVEARVHELARAAGGVGAVRPVVVAPRDAGQSGPVVRPASPGSRSPREETGRMAVPLDVISQVVRAPVRRDLRSATATELADLLDDKEERMAAALELCRRVDAGSVGPVFGALRRMARHEAARVIPAVVKFGERAVPHLVDGLRSRKAYLRQGCALALGVLKSAEGIDPLCELLLVEPTDVWKEVARALGELGGGVVMSLAAHLRGPDLGGLQENEARERVAWALAHVAAKGGRAAVEAVAAGRDATAAGAARRALEHAAVARDNDAEVRGPVAPHDQTVNRAFSRRFYEAMGGVPVGPDEEISDLSGSISLDEDLDSAEILAEVLDDDEILEEEDLVQG